MSENQNDSLYNIGGSMGNINKGLGYQPRTLSDFLSAAQGGQRTARYGVFGGDSLLRKDISTAGDTTISGDFFTHTFGAKVWDALNSQTRAFNLIRKVAWGPTSGWRIRSGRNMSTQGVAEAGVLPTIDSADTSSVNILPAFIVTSIGVSALAQFTSTLEGGIGDALAVQQEAAEVDHLKAINRMLVAPSEIRVATAGASGTAELVNGAQNYVSVGDQFYRSGSKAAGTYVTITGFDADGDLEYEVTAGGNLAADEILYARARGGITSISDVINEDGRTISGVDLAANHGATYASLGYGARAAGSWNAAGYISGNSGTLRHLTTGHLDKVIQEIRINGFQPDMILTGVEQEVRIGTILQANQHFMGEGTFQVKQQGEATLPGYQTGFEVATYKKLPVFTDPDMAPVWQLPTPGNAKRGTDVFVMDTRFLEVPVLFTTQYVESRDPIHNNMLGVKGIFVTAGNLRSLNFRAQGRVTDLSNGIDLT